MKATRALAVAVLLSGLALLSEAVIALAVGRFFLAYVAGSGGALVVAYSRWSCL